MSEHDAEQIKKTADPVTGQPDPPAARQHKDEPFGTTPESSAQAGGAPPGSASHAAAAPGPSGGPPSDGGVPAAGGAPALAPPGKPDGEVDTRT